MNKRKTKEDASIFFEVLGETPVESKNYVKKSMEIAHQIATILDAKGINQKTLAEKLNKKEPEISKWLAGTHNFTIKTLVAIETVLNERIIVTALKPTDAKHSDMVYQASVNQTDYKKFAHGPYKVRVPKKPKTTNDTSMTIAA